MTTIQIGRHNGGQYQSLGLLTIGDSDIDIAAIANEPGGLADLIAMGEWNGPAVIEWTGDEVYEDLGDCPHGCLLDYSTGEYLRPATRQERDASDREVAAGHHEGIIVVDGRSCYVQD